MLREQLADALRGADEGGDSRCAATVRLILAALKERDHAALAAGHPDGASDEDIRAMLADMVAQRQQEIVRCEQCGRLTLAEQEAEEIAIIESFLPEKMGDAAVARAVSDAIEATGARSLKDCGRVMGTLKNHYNGQMDFVLARRLVRENLI